MTATTNLEQQRVDLMGTADPRVADALARFSLARQYAPQPVYVATGNTRISASANS